MLMTPPPDFANFGDRLQWWMAHRGYKQKELAELAGMGQPALNELLKGKTKEPRASHFLGLCHALALRPEYLLDGEGPPEVTNFAQLTGLEAQLVMLFRGLPDDAKRDAMLIDLNHEFNSYQAAKSPPVPPVRLTAAAGPRSPAVRKPAKKLVDQGL